jgi:hypothetical protein
MCLAHGQSLGALANLTHPLLSSYMMECMTESLTIKSVHRIHGEDLLNEEDL